MPFNCLKRHPSYFLMEKKIGAQRKKAVRPPKKPCKGAEKQAARELKEKRVEFSDQENKARKNN